MDLKKEAKLKGLKNLSMDEWINFYQNYFCSLKETKNFVTRCEKQRPPNNIAQIMMHQTQRLISIANDLPKIRPKREPLQLLFLLICAENIAKLYYGFSQEGKSRCYVHKFFNEFLTDNDKSFLGNRMKKHNLEPLGLENTVNLLYNVRCDVVHEGKYWGFFFHNGNIPILNTDPDVNVYLQLNELRDIIIRGCIFAIKKNLN